MTRSNESGFTLIEVLVSALLVGVASVTVLGGISTLGKSSARQRTNSQATAVVQQEIEKWRSTSPSDLADLADGADQTRDVTVGGTTYHLTTSITWSQDPSTAAPTCTGGGPPSYLKVSSTATWDLPDGTTSPSTPSSSTMIAMPVGGIATLQAQVKDKNGADLAGAHVTITGPTPTFGDTNNNGCVLFTNLDPGTYTVKASKPGYVDSTGNPNPTVTQQVSNGGSAIAPPITLAQAGRVKFNFITNGSPAVAQLDRITAKNGALTLGFGTPRPTTGASFTNPKTSLVTSIDYTSNTGGLLYPFPGNWSVYPGGCGTTGTGTNDEYKGATVWSQALTPGTEQPTNVFLPAVTAVFKFNNAFVTGIKVYFSRESSTNCPALTSGCPSWSSSCTYRLPAQIANASGRVPITGMAPGTYDMCAQYTSTSWPYTTYKKTDNNAFTLPMPSSLNPASPPSPVTYGTGTFNIGTGTTGNC